MKKTKLISILLTTSLIINNCAVSLAAENSDNDNDYSQSYMKANLPSNSVTNNNPQTELLPPSPKEEVPELVPQETELTNFDIPEIGKKFINNVKNFVIDNKKALMIGGIVTLTVAVLSATAYYYRKPLRNKFNQIKKYISEKLNKINSSKIKNSK